MEVGSFRDSQHLEGVCGSSFSLSGAASRDNNIASFADSKALGNSNSPLNERVSADHGGDEDRQKSTGHKRLTSDLLVGSNAKRLKEKALDWN